MWITYQNVDNFPYVAHVLTNFDEIIQICTFYSIVSLLE
jgi:hypothetical protein